MNEQQPTPAWVTEFIEKFIKIEYIENSDSMGLYPFPLLAENAAHEASFALLVGLGCKECFRTFADFAIKNQTVVMALDFPQSLDSGSDFIGIFYVDKSKNTGLSVFAIPYDTVTGEMTGYIYDKKVIALLQRETDAYIGGIILKATAKAALALDD